MRKGVMLVVLGLLGCVGGPAWAYDRNGAVMMYVHELLTCSVYYTERGSRLKSDGENMEAYKYFILASDMLKNAKAVLPEAKVRERLAAIEARMAQRRQDESESGTETDAAVRDDYADTCRRLAAAPRERLQFWLDKP